MAEIIAALALEKKALDVVILDLRKLDALTDYFVICTGEVDQHVRAIADYVQDEVKKRTGDRLLHREGRQSLNWVLLDYVDVVVHVFKPAFREYYLLEDLWGDAEARAVKDSVPKAKSRAKAPAKSTATAAAKSTAKPAAKSAAAAKAKPVKPVKPAASKAAKAPAKPAGKAVRKPAVKKVTRPLTSVTPARKAPAKPTKPARKKA